MRFIHEVHGKPQTTGTGKHYFPKITEPPPGFPGYSVDLLATCGSEVICLEGDGFAIKAMLQQLLLLTVQIEQDSRARWDKYKATVKRCKKCRKWLSEHVCEVGL